MAATSKDETSSLTVTRISSDVIVDGILNEAAWAKKPDASNFWQYFPLDTGNAENMTEVWMAFDEEFLYIAAKLYDNNQGQYLSQSLKRDYVSDNVDVFKVRIDPFQDKTNALLFGVNPYGAQVEATLFNGGSTEEDFDLSWDNKWFSGAHINEGYWSMEMAIPFKTLRFDEEEKIWGINFYRVDAKSNERSVWARVPKQFLIINLAFLGEMVFNDHPPKPGSNISVIPYTKADISTSNITGEDEKGLDAGGDIKVAVTPSLNLDITVNPDFSQVEVDRLQTNLDRFEIFYPERRQFFLENADIFSSFGYEFARPFFSRRIGIAVDSATYQFVQNRILAGIRLSGRLNENWRVGLLNMQTAGNQSMHISASNFTTAAVQRKVFERSNIGAFFINKQTAAGTPVDLLNPDQGNYNRVFGLEYNLASADGKWTGKTYYHRSFMKENGDGPYSHMASINYNSRRFFTTWTHIIIGDGFDAKVGFIPRVGFNRVDPAIGFYIYSNSKSINRHRFSLSNGTTWNDTWGVTDNNFAATWMINFQNTAIFSFAHLRNYVKLFFPYNPTGNREKLFQAGEGFHQNGFSVSFMSDQRKNLYFTTMLISGGFYNGTLRLLSGSLNYRYRQYATVALDYSLSKTKLKDDYGVATFLLLGPRIDLTLTTKLYWTTFIQYNDQIDNININSRLQWRYRPVSDLYLVYTSNYYPESFNNKNHALVFKLTYWLNL
jgi:hypothetical protein